MRRHLLPSILAAAAGLAAGWLVAHAPSSSTAESGPASGKSVTAPARHRTDGPEAPPARDFTSYAKRAARPLEQEEAEAAAARMSTGELREVLLAAPDIVWGRCTPEDYLLHIAADAAAAELFRREGVVSIEWAEGAGKKAANAALLKAGCAADPAAAKPHMQFFAETYGYELGWSFAGAALNAAALRNVNDLLQVEKLWSGGGFDYVPGFAADFDFPTYLARTGEPRMKETALAAWAARDPDAALAAFREGIAKDQHWTDAAWKIFNSRATLTSEEEAARWLCPALTGAPDPARSMAIANLGSDLAPSRVAALMENLPEDRDRLSLALGAMRSDMSGGKSSLATLQALPGEELKVQALAKACSGGRDSPYWLRSGSAEDRRARLVPLMDQLQISEAGRQRLLSAIPAG
ncbi:hypothetical protein [Luteolibacter sp. Populi]|uniref:hypothetical protein n=1 Tax=Luteolibacter sp. Populi TaxID=3230487 RepID=UPI003465C0DF